MVTRKFRVGRDQAAGGVFEVLLIREIERLEHGPVGRDRRLGGRRVAVAVGARFIGWGAIASRDQEQPQPQQKEIFPDALSATAARSGLIRAR